VTEQEWLTSKDPAAMLNGLESNGAGKSVTNFKISDRKLRLFACAVVRAQGVTHPAVLAATEAAEAFAEDGVRRSPEYDMNVRDAGEAARYAAGPDWGSSDCPRPISQSEKAAILRCLAGNPSRPHVVLPRDVGKVLKRGAGNYRQEDVILQDWISANVLAVARAAYEVRAADGSLDPLALMVLADALEEAGCPEEVIEQIQFKTGFACPKCGDHGFWRSGQEFDHMKKCRNRACGFTWIPEEVIFKSVKSPHPILAHLRSPVPHYRGCHAVDLILGKS